jgi:hypothetical protein
VVPHIEGVVDGADESTSAVLGVESSDSNNESLENGKAISYLVEGLLSTVLCSFFGTDEVKEGLLFLFDDFVEAVSLSKSGSFSVSDGGELLLLGLVGSKAFLRGKSGLVDGESSSGVLLLSLLQESLNIDSLLLKHLHLAWANGGLSRDSQQGH